MYKTACGNGFPLNIDGGDSADISELESAVQALETAVGDNDSGLVKDVADIQAAIADMYSNVYSTTETIIGKWNNKDLYRKIISIGTLPNNTYAGTDSGIANIDDVISMRGFAKDTSTIINLPYASPTSNDSVSIWYDIASNKVFVNTKNDKSGFTGYVVIEYTKATVQSKKGGK